MRRLGWIAILTTVGCLGMAVGASARDVVQSVSVAYRNIVIQVDGKTVKTSAEPFIVVSSGRTYVPARPLAEALGAKVGWDPATNTVTAYTQRYVQTTTTQSLTTYKLPYWGISVQLPSDGSVLRVPSTQVLLGVKIGDAVVELGHIPSEPSLDLETGVFVKGMQLIIPNFTVSEQHAISLPGASSAVDATGTGSANSSGPLTIRFRLINAGQDTWMVMAMYPQSAAGQDTAIANQAFSSFQFPKAT